MFDGRDAPARAAHGQRRPTAQIIVGGDAPRRVD